MQFRTQIFAFGLARPAQAASEIKNLVPDSGQGTALVGRAGATMTEAVSAIRRVTGIMGEISAATNAQSTGMAQFGEAVAQMDPSTRQTPWRRWLDIAPRTC